jgi:hypothetical protein
MKINFQHKLEKIRRTSNNCNCLSILEKNGDLEESMRPLIFVEHFLNVNVFKDSGKF